MKFKSIAITVLLAGIGCLQMVADLLGNGKLKGLERHMAL
jgi:hypothetical protein